MIKYRTEQLYGEGYRDAAPVMAHEVFELQNTDILETLSNTILKGTDIGIKLNHLMNVIECKVDDEELESFMDEAYDDEELGVSYMDNVLKAIKNITGKNIKYCLWLCDSIDDLKTSYEEDFEISITSIDEYEDSDIILSDLGTYGKLYGYETIPIPCG